MVRFLLLTFAALGVAVVAVGRGVFWLWVFLAAAAIVWGLSKAMADTDPVLLRELFANVVVIDTPAMPEVVWGMVSRPELPSDAHLLGSPVDHR